MTQGRNHRKLTNNFINYCPSCLSSDKEPYYRKKWRLIFSVICPRCKIKLHDCCPNCKSPVSYLRLDIGHKEKIRNKELCICFNCQFDLRKASQNSCSNQLLSFQKRIYQYLDLGYTEKLNYSNLYLEVVHLLMSRFNSKSILARDFDLEISRLMKVSPIKNSSPKPQEIRNLNLRIRIQLLEKTAWLLSHEDEKIVSICKEIKVWSCFLLSADKPIPYWFWRIIREEISIKYTEWKKYHQDNVSASSYKLLARKYNVNPEVS